eukprot:18521-Heterococcus_DN1.PRE.1
MLRFAQHQVFRGVDVDGNGTLDRAEFLKCLRDSGLGFTRRELNLMMTVVDRNNDGVIDYEEFVPVAFNMLLDMVARQLQDVPREEAALREHVKKALNAADRDSITHTEALPLLSGANLGLTLVQVRLRCGCKLLQKHYALAVVQSQLFDVRRCLYQHWCACSGVLGVPQAAAMLLLQPQLSECHEDPATGTYNCEELAEAVAGMVMALGFNQQQLHISSAAVVMR